MVLSIIFIGKKNEKIGNFKDKMIKNWKQSLAIALLSYISAFIGSKWDISYLSDILGPIELFCQCLVGFTIAKCINRYEPLPVTKAVIEHKQQWSKIILMIAFGVLIAFLSVIIGQIGENISLKLFSEVDKSSQSVNMLPENKVLLFFTLFSGAGIGEETVYRLIFLSLFLKISKKPWLSIVLSSLVFGIYHLTPLNEMYIVYWQYPIAQFVSVFLDGIVFGYFYIRRGYETAVIGHTLSDWLPIILFMH